MSDDLTLPETTKERARLAAEKGGGTWSEPRVEYHQLAPPKIVEDTPLRMRPEPSGRARRDLYVPDIEEIEHVRIGDFEVDAPRTVRMHHFTAREWALTLWVPEREEYDAQNNVLHCYGHYRIHRTWVWVED